MNAVSSVVSRGTCSCRCLEVRERVQQGQPPPKNVPDVNCFEEIGRFMQRKGQVRDFCEK